MARDNHGSPAGVSDYGRKEVICTHCGGSGEVSYYDDDVGVVTDRCTHCDGVFLRSHDCKVLKRRDGLTRAVNLAIRFMSKKS